MPSFLTVVIVLVGCATAGSGISGVIRWAARAFGHWADRTTAPPPPLRRADSVCVALGLGLIALVAAVMLTASGLSPQQATTKIGLAGIFSGIFVTAAGLMLGTSKVRFRGMVVIDYDAMERKEIARIRNVDPSEVKVVHPEQVWMRRMGSVGPLWIVAGAILIVAANT